MTEQTQATAPTLSSVELTSMGHQRLDTSRTGAYESGHFVFLANGVLVYGASAFPDMAAVEIHDGLIHAMRESGYGKVLSVGRGEGAVHFRYVNRSWHRLMLGGALLGESLFYRIEMGRRDASQTAHIRKLLDLAGGPITYGPFTLHRDGAFCFSDLVFSPADKVDVESPLGAAARKPGSTHLALMVPPRGVLLPSLCRRGTPRTKWFAFEQNTWHAFTYKDA